MINLLKKKSHYGKINILMAFRIQTQTPHILIHGYFIKSNLQRQRHRINEMKRKKIIFICVIHVSTKNVCIFAIKLWKFRDCEIFFV